MVRVGLVGFFGWGNFGDELMLDVWTSALSGVAEAAPVHSILSRPYFDRPAEAVADEHDHFLIGGGDLVLPDTVSSLYWNRAWLRRPVVVSGVGVALERPTRADVVPRMRDFLGHPCVRAISLRDRESAAWVRDRVAPAVPVEVTPDLGFAAALPPAAERREAVAVVLRKTPTPDDVAAVGRIRTWARSHGLATELLVLATSRTRDEELRELRSAFDGSPDIVTADTTEELCALVGAYRAVISAKFHGLVVALRHGVPVVSLRRTHKALALAEALDAPDLVRPWPGDAPSDPDHEAPTGANGAAWTAWAPSTVDPSAVRVLEKAARDEVERVRRLVTGSTPPADAHPATALS